MWNELRQLTDDLSERWSSKRLLNVISSSPGDLKLIAQKIEVRKSRDELCAEGGKFDNCPHPTRCILR